MTTNKEQLKRIKRNRRHARVRSVISGTTDRPRLAVFRSTSHIYAQIIDDSSGTTLVAASSKDSTTKAAKSELSTEVGNKIAELAKAKGINSVVFDRGGYRYHGRVKTLAEAARTGGLQF
jgi:large subunit ribosomal protein L18